MCGESALPCDSAGVALQERRSSLACIGAKVILFPRGLVAAASVLRG